MIATGVSLRERLRALRYPGKGAKPLIGDEESFELQTALDDASGIPGRSGRMTWLALLKRRIAHIEGHRAP